MAAMFSTAKRCCGRQQLPSFMIAGVVVFALWLALQATVSTFDVRQKSIRHDLAVELINKELQHATGPLAPSRVVWRNQSTTEEDRGLREIAVCFFGYAPLTNIPRLLELIVSPLQADVYVSTTEQRQVQQLLSAFQHPTEDQFVAAAVFENVFRSREGLAKLLRWYVERGPSNNRIRLLAELISNPKRNTIGGLTAMNNHGSHSMILRHQAQLGELVSTFETKQRGGKGYRFVLFCRGDFFPSVPFPGADMVRKFVESKKKEKDVLFDTKSRSIDGPTVPSTPLGACLVPDFPDFFGIADSIFLCDRSTMQRVFDGAAAVYERPLLDAVAIAPDHNPEMFLQYLLLPLAVIYRLPSVGYLTCDPAIPVRWMACVFRGGELVKGLFQAPWLKAQCTLHHYLRCGGWQLSLLETTNLCLVPSAQNSTVKCLHSAVIGHSLVPNPKLWLAGSNGTHAVEVADLVQAGDLPRLAVPGGTTSLVVQVGGDRLSDSVAHVLRSNPRSTAIVFSKEIVGRDNLKTRNSGREIVVPVAVDINFFELTVSPSFAFLYLPQIPIELLVFADGLDATLRLLSVIPTRIINMSTRLEILDSRSNTDGGNLLRRVGTCFVKWFPRLSPRKPSLLRGNMLSIAVDVLDAPVAAVPEVEKDDCPSRSACLG